MADNEDWWRSKEGAQAEALRARIREARRRKQQYNFNDHMATFAKWQEVWKSYEDNPEQRNWDIWRDYRTNKITLAAVGEKYGVSGSCVSGIVKRYDAKVKRALNICWLTPIHEAREGVLGVEFVFRHEDSFVGPAGEINAWTRLDGKEAIYYRCRKADEGED
jgi:hypothetical protein